MTLVVHVSDLHLLGEPREQDAILASFLAALEKERARRGRKVDLLCITGDVFESATVDPTTAVRELAALHRCMMHSLGGEVPTIIVPGNHDRRRSGLFGPHRDELFDAVHAGMHGGSVFVHGCQTPFLGAVVPHALHQQPLWTIAYDSTYLPSGYLSAGGLVRQEDLLYAAAEIDGHEPDWPVLFLLHHHLVPTPLTDLGPIETHRSGAFVRFGVQHVLPHLVAHGDREELTMTALGAGTALTTLHTLGRAVLVLHGHKHISSARKLEGMDQGQGDVLTVGAGSAGTAQRWSPTAERDTARLWPSFNVIELEEGAMTIETVSFGWKGRSSGEVAYRPLVWAAREGARWKIQPIERAASSSGPRLLRNESRVRLLPARQHGTGRWDFECLRRVEAEGPSPHRYLETVEMPPGAVLERIEGQGPAPQARVQSQVELDPRGETTYRVAGGLCRTLGEARRVRGYTAAPFEQAALMTRYESVRASLVVEGLGDAARRAFASVTDLGTGREEPLSCTRDALADRVTVEIANCSARTLLRVYWPLDP